MFKDFLLVKASPLVAKEKVRDYLQFSHAPLALSTAEVGRAMKLYTMNHLVDDDPCRLCLYPVPGNLATVVEHSLMGGAETVHKIMTNEEYIAKVVPDEQYMIENLMAGMPQFIAVEREEIIFENTRKSSNRMFEFLRRLPGVSREDFLRLLRAEGVWASASEKYTAAVERRVHSIVGSGPLPVGATSSAPSEMEEPFDAVVEVWISQPEILAGLIDEISEMRVSYTDPDHSLAALTKENVIRR